MISVDYLKAFCIAMGAGFGGMLAVLVLIAWAMARAAKRTEQLERRLRGPQVVQMRGVR